MPLEVICNKFEHTHENITFRDIARMLTAWMEQKGEDGLLIGNPNIELDSTLHPDILLFTANSIVVIDLKNYGGQINLPPERRFQSSIWTMDSLRIKGGSYINPFAQLSNHRRKIINILKSVPTSETQFHQGLKPNHISTMVYFHKPISINGKIPGNFEKSFFIADQAVFLNLINDIVSTTLKLTPFHFDKFKTLFEASPYNIDQVIEEKEETIIETNQLLWDGQNDAHHAFDKFLQSEDRILILAGAEKSGKTFLIPSLQDAAFEKGFQQVEVLAPTSRIANRLYQKTNITFTSIYSLIYGGMTVEEKLDLEEKEEEATPEEEAQISKEIIGIRASTELEENSILIIDEAHLITNSLHDTEFLRFGTGHVLSDILSFINFESNHRKIVFIGDSYQLSYGKVEENALQEEYLQKLSGYNVSYQFIKNRVKEATPKSRLQQNLKVARSIDFEYFNNLNFFNADEIRLNQKEEVKAILSDCLNHNRNFTFLTYMNKEAQKINLWIREKILRHQNELDPKDLLLLNNTINVPNENPLAKPARLINGEFLIVKEVLEVKSEVIKGINLVLQKLKVYVPVANENLTIWSLENYRKSESGSLTKEEMVALKIFQYKRIKILKKENPFEKSKEYQQCIDSSAYRDASSKVKEFKERESNGERVKGKREQAEIDLRKLIKAAKRKYNHHFQREAFYKDPLANPAFLRFGWAMTVHKSVGANWDYVIFNTPMGNAGRSNRTYFQWLYTGIARSNNKIHLVNFDPITPTINTAVTREFEIATTEERLPIAQVQVTNEGILTPKETKFAEGYDFDFEQVAQIKFGQEVRVFFESRGYGLISVVQNNYHDAFNFQEEEKEFRLAIYYNNRWQFKSPTIQSASTPDVKASVESLLGNLMSEGLMERLTPEFKITNYEDWKEILKEVNIELHIIKQVSYRDQLLVVEDKDWVSFDVNYNDNGFFSSIYPVNGTNGLLWTKSINLIIPNKND